MNRDLTQTDAAAERRRSKRKSLFIRSQGQVNATNCGKMAENVYSQVTE